MLRVIFFPSYSLQRRYQSVTILNLTKTVFGKGLEERLLHTSVPQKENQNRLKTIYLFLFFFFNYTTLHEKRFNTIWLRFSFSYLFMGQSI